jgi:hypothetical protein
MKKRTRPLFLLLLIFAAACTPAIQRPEPMKTPLPPPVEGAGRPEETGTVRTSGEAVRAPEAKAGEREYPAREEKAKDVIQSPFRVTPRGIDFGSIGPGAAKDSVFNLEFSEMGALDWVLEGLFDWRTSGAENLSGRVDRRGAAVKVRLKCSRVNGDMPDDNRKAYPVQLIFENDRQILSYEKTLTPGYYGEKVVFVTRAGEEAVSIMFRVVPRLMGPIFAIDPPALDLGTVEAGQSMSKRVRLTNKGTGTLRWQAIVKSAGRGRGGSYVSFLNEEIRQRGSYVPPSHLGESLEMSGMWLEENGYPVAEGSSEAMLRYKFTGTGVDVFFREGPESGNIRASVDDRAAVEWSAMAAEEKKRAVLRIAEGLPEAQHSLTLAVRGGPVMVEGLRVYSKNVRPGPSGWIRISPDNGYTTREIDFVTIRVQTAGMAPGLYNDSVVFRSEEDEITVEVSLAVSPESTGKVIPIYRYMKGSDQFLTDSPGAEDAGLLKGYQRQGLAFRLFTSGTPGTSEFYRWFNAARGSHYYAFDQDKKPVPAGYARERLIGNIATVKLAGSRELYRWYNPKTGFYYYTTDSGGEGFTKKGFRFDGTAGYVK